MENVSLEDFHVISHIGTGAFSYVYHVVHKSGQHFAMKQMFWNCSPDRIEKELTWLTKFHDPRVVSVHAIIRKEDSVNLILDLLPNIPFRCYFQEMDGSLIRDYMFSLLSALQVLHSRHIIHRDIKPSNFLFDPASRTGTLIDLGMCEEETAIIEIDSNCTNNNNENINDNLNGNNTKNDIEKNPLNSIFSSEDPIDNDFLAGILHTDKQHLPGKTEGTRGFRAPEVLFHSINQTTAIDMWACGVILLVLLSKRYPFFKSDKNIRSIREIACVLGTAKLQAAASECDRILQFPIEIPGYPLRDLVLRLNMDFNDLHIDDCVFDLLEQLLEPSPKKRITAEKALQHPFFRT